MFSEKKYLLKYMSKPNKSFNSQKWKDAKYRPSGKQYNKTRRKKPELECIKTGAKIFCNKKKTKAKAPPKAPPKKSAKQAVMSRAKAPARKARTKFTKYDFKPHMMYKGKTSKKANTYDDHQKLKKEGYTHTKPKEAVMSRAKAPARRPKKTMKKYDFKKKAKPKPKPKPRSNDMAKAYMSQVGKFLFKSLKKDVKKEVKKDVKKDIEKMNATEYRKFLGKKIKDFSSQELTFYNKLKKRGQYKREKEKKKQQ